LAADSKLREEIEIFLQVWWHFSPVAYTIVCSLNPIIDIHVLLANFAFEPRAARGEWH